MLDFHPLHLGMLVIPSLAAVFQGLSVPSWPGGCISKDLETSMLVAGSQK